jgi:prolyl-tRNA synthetase
VRTVAFRAVVARMSTLFLRTLRDDPADAEVPSHRLLVRAGYVRRIVPGIYSLLPLGVRIYQNIERIVKEEMDAMGGQQVHFPGLIPKEPYEASNRWTEYGDNIFRLKDRRKNDFLLAPTHEEMFTLMVKGEYSSYRDFPVIIYQIQTKYRDEARPRSGIMRGREFVMKDSYSFDLTDDGLAASYERHRDAYIKTFDRLGISYRIVSAMSGAMGGSKSEEFLAPSPVGEDTFVMCRSCEYAANVEAVQVQAPEAVPTSTEHAAMRTLHTPDCPGITALVVHLNERYSMGTDASKLLKNILFKVDGKPIMVLVPGDREIDEERLAAAVSPGVLEPFEDSDFAANPSFVKGYVSAIGMQDHGVMVYADTRIAANSNWVTGANQHEHHVVDAVVGRDFHIDRTIEVATVAQGDPCPVCGEPLDIDRAIEIGHIFQLGRKYADAFQLDALGPDSKPIRITMGSYGIGVTRAVAVIAEQWHDSAGLVWPVEVAPYRVHIIAAGKDGQMAAALALGERFDAAGISVLVDDRDGPSVGVKFKDAELLGMPTIIVVGRGLADGVVELRDRRSGERRDVALGEVVSLVAG